MLSGEKILITGATGATTTLPAALSLAADNEVWGVARFTDPEARERLEAGGVTTRCVDLAKPDLRELPEDFSYVLHFAHARMGAGEFVPAIQVNAIGAGHVLKHCRNAKAALVASSAALYSVREDDPFHAFAEGDDVGRSFTPWAPASPASKVSLEAVARFCAEAFDLPVTIARISCVYGPEGGLPILHMDAVARGEGVVTTALPYPHVPLHTEDFCEQIEALLAAAAAPATLVNWGGDEVVTVEEWCAEAARLSGRKVEFQLQPVPGSQCGAVLDTSRRRSITGPCRKEFRREFEALFRQRHGGTGG
ncbi:MAG: NAD(P)-dependent oxidoreductase [Myxococcota bacterium]